MADCLISPVQEIGKCILTQYVWPFLRPQVDYWWRFDNNIQELRDGIDKLKRKESSIKQEIESARLLTHIPCPEVEEWLRKTTEKLAEARRILQDDNIPRAWDLRSRYSLGKNAKETANQITILLNEADLIQITYPPPPAAMASPHDRSNMDFESRQCIEEDIINSLKESTVDMVGICGMGGVGKTTMARRIWKRVKEENLFEEVVMVTVSQKIDSYKIQNEIAELLGLKFEVESIPARAHQLCTRLMDTKRKIIIFDDVWKSLELKDLGVPQSCKILLTTRYKDVCEKMKAQKIIAVETLTDGEAWILFKDIVGICLENSNLHSLAQEVVKECKGLPLALAIVGKCLQNKEKYIWKDSLKKLKEAHHASFGEVKEDVYEHLKLSYDYLDDDSQRYLFLLCCLFPEDYNIRVEQLIWHIMGLQLFWHGMDVPLFDDITNIEEARDRTHNLVDKLKSLFLLIDGKDKLHVKMHDVVRDVAIYIGSKEKKGFLKSLTSIKKSSDDDCNWMSANISIERSGVPVVLRFPKLRLLMLLKWGSNELSDIRFEGTEDLNVLSLETISIRSLPPMLGSLGNLQTLCLVHCGVENISVIGKLSSLKFLSCYRCANITELPAEIRSLSGLRLLELNGCYKLQRIPFGVISSLRRLEELKMRGSFRRWEAEENGKERGTASLTELGSLPNLSWLEIEIDDCNLSAQEICLSENLVKYYILIGYQGFYFDARDYEKVMILSFPSSIGAVGKWIQTQVRNTECLYLEGDGCGSNNFNIAESENLMDLIVTKCSTLNKLVETKDCKFHNLKFIKITNCPELRSLFSVSAARRCLLQLELLYIEECKSMEQVFWNEIRDDNTDGGIEFPMLKQLTLDNLPKLTVFCQGLEKKDDNTDVGIEFPMLKQLTLNNLPKLTAFCQGLEKNDVSFCNLESIRISGCDNLRSRFLAARRCLLQLEVLEITYCKSMEQVFWNEIRDDNTDGCIEFPMLKKLTLNNLPKLTAFCQGLEKNDVSLCNLKSIRISACHNLRSLFSVSAARRCLLQLEVLNITYCKSMEQVFWNEIRDDNTDGCIEFPMLKQLTLWNLPNLTAFCQGLEKNDVSFSNLKSIYIRGCHNLRSLFSVSAARRCLLQLEVLSITDCESMEQVFWNEIRDDNTDGGIECPKLTAFWQTLWNLPNLTAFWQGLENIIIKFPNLTQLSIGGLPKLNSLSPLNSETLVWHDHTTCSHFVCNPKDVSFCNLKSIYISGFDNLRSLFSVSAARRCLLQLEVLYIRYCESMEQVFWNEGTDDNTDDGCIEFPKLKQLSLCDLPNLTAFCQGLENIIIKFPNLTQLDIEELPKLNSLSPLNSETLDHTTCSLHFVCNPKVEMGGLKFLKLWNFGDNIRNIWCHQIQNNVFNNLETLDIYFMNGIRSLMSTSIAINLVTLKDLRIGYCKEMVDVIERDDDDKQVVDDTNCWFPNLKTLNIRHMDKLRRFWQWNHALKLPLLEEVSIEGCPVMETFTLGSINTPNIRVIKVNDKKIDDQKDLNDVTRHIWTKSQGTSKADRDRNGNENEDKDESKDAYINENVNKDEDSSERK